MPLGDVGGLAFLGEGAEGHAQKNSALAARIQARSVKLSFNERLRARVLLCFLLEVHGLVLIRVHIGDIGDRVGGSGGRGGGSGGCFACGETNEFGGSFEVLPEGDGVGSRASAFADANKGLNVRVRDSFEVGVVVCAGDGDSGGRRAALGAGGCELGVHGGAVGFGGVEFRVEARGGGGKLGLAARETVDAVIDLTKCRKGQDGGAAGGILLDSTTFAAMAS